MYCTNGPGFRFSTNGRVQSALHIASGRGWSHLPREKEVVKARIHLLFPLVPRARRFGVRVLAGVDHFVHQVVLVAKKIYGLMAATGKVEPTAGRCARPLAIRPSLELVWLAADAASGHRGGWGGRRPRGGRHDAACPRAGRAHARRRVSRFPLRSEESSGMDLLVIDNTNIR